MKKVITLLALTVFAFGSYAGEGHDGKTIFKKTCASCHQIGKGKLVGPDLMGVEGRYDKEWLYSWIKSSQTMVNEGDELAVKLFEENNKLLMPDNAMEDAEIDALLAYIADEEVRIAEAGKSEEKTASAPVVAADSGGGTDFMDPFMMIIIAAMAVMIFSIFAQNYAVMMLMRRIRDEKSQS